MIEKLINKLESVFGDIGYKLWFGTKNDYNGNREWTEKDIILEPFTFPLDLENTCEWKSDWTLWVAIANEYGGEGLQGDAKKMDYLRDETLKIMEVIKNQHNLAVPKKLYELDVQYYESNSNATVNNQALIRINFPIQIFNSNV